MKNAKKAYLLTNKSKLTDHISHTLCELGDLTGVIADFEFPKETKEQYPNTQFICVEE